jgi:F-type H+-transporting ATPase subunit delta
MPFLKDPKVSSAEKKKKLGSVLGGKASALSLRFLELLIDKKRFALLPLVAANLVKLVAEENNLVKAQVRTARPLSQQEQERLRVSLKKFAGKDIELEVKEDPDVIGGLVVRLGDWVLDSSLRGQVRQMGGSIG